MTEIKVENSCCNYKKRKDGMCKHFKCVGRHHCDAYEFIGKCDGDCKHFNCYDCANWNKELKK